MDHLSHEVLVKAADLAARIGLHSTGIRFPVTADDQFPRKPEICFSINVTNETNCNVSIDTNDSTNFCSFQGEKEAVVQALTYFATAKPFQEGGTFRGWEKVFSKKASEPQPLLPEKTWEDTGEKNQLETTLSNWSDEESITDDHLSIVTYVSEPISVRGQLMEKYSERLSEKAKQADVLVRSAYKPGYFWVEEEVIPLIKTYQKLSI
jgi:hypothetical protein